MSAPPPQSPKLIVTPSIRTRAQEKKRLSSAVEELELPYRQKKTKIAHEPEQAEAGPSTPPQQELSTLVPATPYQPEFSALITAPEYLSPYPAQGLTTIGPVIKTVRQRDLSPLSTVELLNFMRVDMMLHAFSFGQRLSFHGEWIHHEKAPVYPASLGPLPIEPRNTIAYADSIILAATNYLKWQLSDIRETSDGIEAQYPLFGPMFPELSALHSLAATPSVSLYKLVNVHYPSPPVEGNVALMVARVEDLVDELNRYQQAMIDQDLALFDPLPTCLLPIEERNCPEVVAVLLEEVADTYKLGEFRREDRQELPMDAQLGQILSLEGTQSPPLCEPIEQEDMLPLLPDHQPSPSPPREPLEHEHALRRHTSSEPDLDDFMQEDFDPPNWQCAIAGRSSYDDFARQYLE
ncbi:hypothetical protein MMC27_004556 [Xylographa pallens]|nr:hypothetical protein [Xylographa pallens]